MLIKTSPTMQRAMWINEAEKSLRELFDAHDFQVPAEVRTSWGFPKGTKGGHKGTIIGQCWFSKSSSDQHNEIFLSPALGHKGEPTFEDTVVVLATHAHELAHSICGHKAGHRIIKRREKGERGFEKFRLSFPNVCDTIGLVSPWTATSAGDDFVKWAKPVVKKIDLFPAGALESFARKKDSNRQLKCECEGCGYIVRTTKKWIEKAGPPICPVEQEVMVCEGIED